MFSRSNGISDRSNTFALFCAPGCTPVCTPVCAPVCAPVCTPVCTPVCARICTPVCAPVCTLQGGAGGDGTRQNPWGDPGDEFVSASGPMEVDRADSRGHTPETLPSFEALLGFQSVSRAILKSAVMRWRCGTVAGIRGCFGNGWQS